MTHLPVEPALLEPPEPDATPRRRPRRAVLAASAALAAVAVLALVLTNGGTGASSSTEADDGLALGGVQAPGTAAPGKSVGGRTPSEKVVGGVAAKGSTTSAAPGSTTTGTGAGAAAVVAGRAAPGSTTSGGAGAPGSSATPGPGAAGTAATPTTAPPTTAPPTTSRPATTGGGTTGGGTWTPTGPTYWLATDGNDANNGTEGAPWRSFATALHRLRPGDTLLVKAGTYGNFSSTAIDINGINGAAGAPITVAAAPGQQVRLLGGGWQVVYVANSTYVDVRNFEVVGNAPADHSDANGIEVAGSHHVRIIGNTVHDVGGGGIGANHSNHVTVDGNRIYNTSNWNEYQTSAISLFESANIGGGNNADGFSFYVRNNVAWNNRTLVGVVSDGNCIIVDSNRHTGYAGATSITNNLCYANGGRGVHVFIADNVVAVNNTLVGNLTSSQMFDSGELSAIQAGNISFRNNLVVPGRDGNGTAEYAASGVSYANNLFVGRAPAHHGASDRIVADARLNADHVPLTGSPAIDAGTTDGAPPTDRRGRSRNGAPDIGCYEI